MVRAHRHAMGVVRREFLQVGFSGLLGMGLGSRAQVAPASPERRPRARSMILVFLTGGPSHIDTFDPKPEAPEGIRGTFKAVPTKAPGLFFTEHLPGLAARADRLAVVRSLSHRFANHLNATHEMLTGHAQPGAFFDKIASRDDFPNYASALQALQPPGDGMPAGVLLPTFLMEGPLVWPGQHAGFLGPRFDPWQIKQDPSQASFRVDSLGLPAGCTVERLQQRERLYEALGRDRDAWLEAADGDPFADQHRKACELLLSNRVADAFELDREPAEVRDRYGRHMYGQSLLLARRLIEAGVPIVQANMGRVQTWDTHNDNFRRLEKELLPPLDRGVSALLDDLAASGRLDETLVIIAGEFGRTPRIGKGLNNAAANESGRDHWPAVYSAAFAGAGIVGGRAIGASDRNGAYPAESPFSPGDFAATVYQSLGLDLETEFRDRLNRPLRLVQGTPIAELFSS